MKVYNSPEEFTPLPNAVVTIGTFDGLHKGHLKILSRLKEAANSIQAETVVITFWPHPRAIICQDDSIKLLSTREEKINLIADFGIDHLLIIPFTKEFSETSSMDFINKVLIEKIGTRKLVIGYDHKFGKNREGSFEYLKEKSGSIGFEVEEIPRQDIDDVAISSSAIRKALSESNVERAAEFLGRIYSVSGTVIKGNQLGRTIGYPTANIGNFDSNKLLPADGIYAVTVELENQKFGGMLSLGNNPTVPGKGRSMEVYIFDFNMDIYGKTITVGFLKYLRKEEHYNSLEALKQQLILDEQNSRAALKDFKH